ncbi:MAG: arginyltransferase [Betaproteobacteria bacterium]|nr:arginyltransferase [Betaproteobacteria bacterium]MCL2887041.1 arginyltransferase [Betaproteobacteria bacterium]
MAQPDDADLPFSLLQFYATAPYPCSYLPGRQACSQVAVPAQLIDTRIYAVLVRAGFRRSGMFTYRPWCAGCRACIPVRLPVAEFQATRHQRRALKRHAGLQARELPLVYRDEHYALYNRYQRARHPGGGMDDDDRDQYAQFLLQSGIDTRLIEFSEAGAVRMVSLIDVLDDGLSSVYTFYEPALAGSSLGVYSILWQRQQCLALGLPYLYLGYWIATSRKMAYKADFQPIEGLLDGDWQRLSPPASPLTPPPPAMPCR